MARYRVVPDRSQLWAEARSSLHPVKVETSGLTGTVDAEVDGEAVRLGAPFRVEIDAARLRSGTGLIDGELQRRLETRKFPTVIGEVRETESQGGASRWLLRGALTLHGVTCPADAEVAVRVIDDRTIEIEGEKVIDMRDYGLDPPRLLMLRVHPDVRVRARLVARRED
ncbi:MAG TPA: YceI family protein [Kofleriaceae bacterium]|nr:YceI family protein [Kofleriaceae bacterium]